MKIKYFLIAALILVVGFAFFYPVNQQVSVTINTSMFNVYNQLSNAENWEKWDSELKGSATNVQHAGDKKGFTISTSTATIEVKPLDALAFGIKKDDKEYVVFLVPEKYDKTTNVNVVFNTSLLYSWLPGQKDRWLKRSSIADLKNYIENPASYYGADFRKVSVDSMNMMVIQMATNKKDLFTAIAKAAKALHALVPATDLTVTDKIYLQLTPSNSEGGLAMMAGVPVKKPLKSTKELTFMLIPAGKALIVDYRGRYNERAKTYDGVQAYIHDHAMKNTMSPIEIYQDNSLPVSDTSRIEAKIIFRVF